jgi:hypothetical protein
MENDTINDRNRQFVITILTHIACGLDVAYINAQNKSRN